MNRPLADLRLAALSRLARVLGTSALVAVASCRSKSSSTGERPAGSVAASLEKPAASAPTGTWSCHEIGNAPLVIGQSSKRAPSSDEADDDDSDVELPFTVEVGAARSGPASFAVGGVQSEHGESRAFLARVDAATAHAQSLPLGRVFGDVEPPAVVPFRAGWIALLADNDARAVTLRLIATDESLSASSLRRGAEIQGVRRDASGFSLELGADEGLVAFSQLEHGHGVIALARFDPERLTLKGKPRTAPAPAAGDAESPRLVARRGGYYLAWIVRGAVSEADKLMHPDAGTDQDPRLLEEGPTAIEIVPLDATGAPTSTPKRVTRTGARVLAFDLIATAADGALIVYRDERDGPGLDRSGAEAVLLRADGSSESRSWELGDSTGVPSLFADPRAAAGSPALWLSVSDESGARQFPIGDDALTLGEAKPDGALAGAEALAVAGGRWFVTRVRGGQREFFTSECRGSL